MTPSALTLPLRRALLGWLVIAPWTVAAHERPFARPPEPQAASRPPGSAAVNANEYRLDAARHLYATYPAQVLKGQVRANVYAILVTETDVDAQGKVLAVRVLRPPAQAREVTPWVVSLIRRASPLPPPLKMKRVRYVETWLVDQSGQFQVRTLTEGQI